MRILYFKHDDPIVRNAKATQAWLRAAFKQGIRYTVTYTDEDGEEKERHFLAGQLNETRAFVAEKREVSNGKPIQTRMLYGYTKYHTRGKDYGKKYDFFAYSTPFENIDI